tara:strand:- start:990 stop:1166 length:177 start_codon:yes stop_codon:yes gene_type:complete
MISINQGQIYEISWFGSVNEVNGWGAIYPIDADGSYLRADTTLQTSDNSILTADKTIY